MNLPEKVYTEADVTRARRNGQIVGWVQGGAAVVVGGLLLNLIPWIPTLLVAGGLGYAAYRFLVRRRPRELDES